MSNQYNPQPIQNKMSNPTMAAQRMNSSPTNPMSGVSTGYMPTPGQIIKGPSNIPQPKKRRLMQSYGKKPTATLRTYAPPRTNSML